MEDVDLLGTENRQNSTYCNSQELYGVQITNVVFGTCASVGKGGLC